jgi:regulator of nucleoside diphosphate kinase
MQPSINVERTLTTLDFARLTKLLGSPVPSALTDLLTDAEVLDSTEIPADIVTMYTQVEIEDIDTRLMRQLVLCYPDDAEPSAGFISVLSPVGTSLLGLKTGSVARWRSPSGEEAAAQVMALLFQPEASGDYTS